MQTTDNCLSVIIVFWLDCKEIIECLTRLESVSRVDLALNDQLEGILGFQPATLGANV